MEVIRENRARLSEIDGAIGDGDHGINMAKGFTLAGERLPADADLTAALQLLGRTLLMEIGGAMGPLYGRFFKEMARAAEGRGEIDAAVFAAMLREALAGVRQVGGAQVGDKTLVDVLDPASAAFGEALGGGAGFANALEAMCAAAERGRDSTRDLVARVGRAARLGERSRGALDAGAASCQLILRSMADSIRGLLEDPGSTPAR